MLTRDGHFVCLHDDELAAETTGQGLVREHDRAAIERLRQCDNERRPLATPPLFLDEVAGRARRARRPTGRAGCSSI